MMKFSRIVSCVLIMCLLISCFGGYGFAGSVATPITIEDPMFEAAIREHINKPEGQLTNFDVCNIMELKLVNANIKSIKGIEAFERLRKLDLSFNRIEEIESLSELKHLKELTLYSNEIESLEGIEKLERLEVLIVSDNKIRKIYPIEDLIQLRKLHVNDNRISDLSPLRYLSQVTDADFSDNEAARFGARYSGADFVYGARGRGGADFGKTNSKDFAV